MENRDSRLRHPEVLALAFMSKHLTHLLSSLVCVKTGTKLSNSQIVVRVKTEDMQRS